MLLSPDACPCLQKKDAVGRSPWIFGRSSAALGQKQLEQASNTSEADQNEGLSV